MRSVQLESSLREFVEEAGARLQREVERGAEVPFELAAQRTGRRADRTALYCYRPLTGRFIRERAAMIAALPSHAPAARLLDQFPGLDRHLLARDIRAAPGDGQRRAAPALRALVEEVFREQSDFHLLPERVEAALARIEDAAAAGAGEVTIAATLHGLAIASPELALPGGLVIAAPETLTTAPEQVISASGAASGGAWEEPWDEPGRQPAGHLVALYTAGEGQAPRGVVSECRRALRELLLALRLFGDGRIAMGPLAWVSVDRGSWVPLALGWGGRPHGVLVLPAEQEEQLRAFCGLVARRVPRRLSIAWALRRFEMGCERPSEHEALSDHLLGLQALLEPERASPGLLAARACALCATPEMRGHVSERVLAAVALERQIVRATAPEQTALIELVREIAGHLRALLRDVICGHLDDDLVTLADQLLLAGEGSEAERPDSERLVEEGEISVSRGPTDPDRDAPADTAPGAPRAPGVGTGAGAGAGALDDPLHELAREMPLF
ncbi:MAG: hypothetical protein FWD42_10500 [Solirubrobacterales bacterium]|nr:hypothetical protein [Solirubrobacterales bacterium]